MRRAGTAMHLLRGRGPAGWLQRADSVLARRAEWNAARAVADEHERRARWEQEGHAVVVVLAEQRTA